MQHRAFFAVLWRYCQEKTIFLTNKLCTISINKGGSPERPLTKQIKKTRARTKKRLYKTLETREEVKSAAKCLAPANPHGLLLDLKACSNGSCEPPSTLHRGSFGGKFPPTVSPKAPKALPIYGRVETPLIYRVSFNSSYILITPFLHDINPVWVS